MASGLMSLLASIGKHSKLLFTGCCVGRELLWRCFKPCSKQTQDIIAASWAMCQPCEKLNPHKESKMKGSWNQVIQM